MSGPGCNSWAIIYKEFRANMSHPFCWEQFIHTIQNWASWKMFQIQEPQKKQRQEEVQRAMISIRPSFGGWSKRRWTKVQGQTGPPRWWDTELQVQGLNRGPIKENSVTQPHFSSSRNDGNVCTSMTYKTIVQISHRNYFTPIKFTARFFQRWIEFKLCLRKRWIFTICDEESSKPTRRWTMLGQEARRLDAVWGRAFQISLTRKNQVHTL